MSRTEGKLIRTESRKLAVRLSPEEVNQRGHQLAALEGEQLDFRMRKKNQAAALKQEETELDRRIHELAAAVRGKAELRDVEVEIRRAGRASVVELRTDTGEVLLERAASESERQEVINFPAGDA